AGARKRKAIVPPELIAQYRAGESIEALHRSFKIACKRIRNELRDLGVPLRSQSERELLKWQTYRESMMASHGNCYSAPTLAKRAATRQGRRTHIGRGEREVAEALSAAEPSLELIPQMAVGRYNLDIGVPSCRVAVEIERAMFGAKGRERVRERVKNLLDLGWSVIIIVLDRTEQRRRRFLPEEVAKKVIAFIQLVRRKHPARGQYRMIASDGKLETRP